MKKLILLTIATTVMVGSSPTPQRTILIDEAFNTADTNKDGKVSKNQLDDYIESKKNRSQWKKIWWRVKKYSKKAYSATLGLFKNDQKDQVAMDKKTFTQFYDVIVKNIIEQPNQKEL